MNRQHAGFPSGWVLALMVLAFCWGSSLAAAEEEDLAHADAPPSDLSQKIFDMESDYAALSKQVQESPNDGSLKAKMETARSQICSENFNLGRKLEKDGYILAAINSYQHILLYDPQSVPASKAMERAKKNLKEVERKQSKAAYDEAVRDYQAGDVKGAVEELTKALEFDSENKEAQAALESINPHPEPAENAPQHPKKKPVAAPRVPQDLNAPDTSEEEEEPSEDAEIREAMWDQDYRQGMQHEGMKEYEDALKSYKKALSENPKDKATQDALARVQAVVDNVDKEKSQDLYLLGVYSAQHMDYKGAYQYLCDSLEADPSNKDARTLREQLVRQNPGIIKPVVKEGQAAPAGH